MNSQHQITQFQRRGDALVRDLQLALQRAMIANKGAGGPEKTFNAGIAKLERELQQFAKITPHAADWVTLYLAHLRKQGSFLIGRARNAEKRRAEVTGLKKRYNDLVSESLASAAPQGRKAVQGQVKKLVSQLVESSFRSTGAEPVPSKVRQQVTTELTKWLESQELVEDAYFVVERTLTDLAGWLNQRLTLQGEIELTRDTLVRDKEVTKPVLEAAEARVGALAKQGRDLDRGLERSLQRTANSYRTNFSLRPNLVLDPARRFVKDVELRAGVDIRHNGVNVDLRTNLKVIDPFTDPRYQAGLGLTGTVPAKNLSFGVNGNVSGAFDGGGTEYEVRAYLKWSF